MAKQNKNKQLTLQWDKDLTPEKLDHFLNYADAVRLFNTQTTNQQLITDYLSK